MLTNGSNPISLQYRDISIVLKMKLNSIFYHLITSQHFFVSNLPLHYTQEILLTEFDIFHRIPCDNYFEKINILHGILSQVGLFYFPYGL